MATKRRVGPFFVAFPNIREALANNTPIKTDARSCTILPNFVGYVFDSSLKEGVRV
jgi:ribosomal protein S19